MSDNSIKVVSLSPMIVASFHSISENPEREAWIHIAKYAKKKGIFGDLKNHPVYGFNNPDPSPNQKKYGYEFWIQVDSSFLPEGKIKIKSFSGGLYATKRCNLTRELKSEFFQKYEMLESWHLLDEWVQKSEYKLAPHQAIEKSLNPGAENEDLILELYFPIEK